MPRLYRVFVCAAILLCSAPAVADPPRNSSVEKIERLREWWRGRRVEPAPTPRPQTETPAPVPPEVVEALPPPPKIEEPKPPTADATPSPDPAPKTVERVRPGPGPKMRPRPRVKKEERERNKTAQSRSISAADCKRLRDAIATYGSGVVEMGARVRGYSSAQIAFARRACGVR